MHTKALKLAVMAAAVLIAMQTVYLLIPPPLIMLYDRLVRPGVYIFLTVTVSVCLGRNARIGTRAKVSVLVAGVAVLLFVGAFLLMLAVSGGGRNPAAAGWSVVARSFWQVGVVFASAEYIRFRLMRASHESTFMATMVLIVAGYTFAGLGVLRVMVNLGHFGLPDMLFASLLSLVMVNVTATYLAAKGSAAAVLLVSAVYSLSGTFSPIVPTVQPMVWSLVTAVLLFICAMLYYFLEDENVRIARRQTQKAMRYKNPAHGIFVFNLALFALLISFFMGAFAFYPTVILTGSMAGTLERGGIAIVRRVDPAHVVSAVGEGYVIHFKRERDGAQVVHRVVEFRYGADGERIFITQGDANPVPDTEPVTQAQVLGVVRMHMPFAGFPYVFVREMVRG